ncbi:hypothetical protein BH10PSE6_BH10PSE6_15920 [soil metagenome]
MRFSSHCVELARSHIRSEDDLPAMGVTDQDDLAFL